MKDANANLVSGALDAFISLVELHRGNYHHVLSGYIQRLSSCILLFPLNAFLFDEIVVFFLRGIEKLFQCDGQAGTGPLLSFQIFSKRSSGASVSRFHESVTTSIGRHNPHARCQTVAKSRIAIDPLALFFLCIVKFLFGISCSHTAETCMTILNFYLISYLMIPIVFFHFNFS